MVVSVSTEAAVVLIEPEMAHAMDEPVWLKVTPRELYRDGSFWSDLQLGRRVRVGFLDETSAPHGVSTK